MNNEVKKTNKINRKISGKKKLYYCIATLLVVTVLIAGFSYAWFYNKTDMATLVEIKPPSDISILGPGGKEITSLDLNYTDANKSGDRVTIRRVICVQSGESIKNYKLEIVHTTNLKCLSFNLYQVSENGTESITDGDYSYKYNSGDQNKISGSYINLQNYETTSDYKYATDKIHTQNYGSYSKVQKHAEPLYWLTNKGLTPSLTDTVTIKEENYNRTYYVCEISWTETTKETDIFYILAKTE